MSGSTGRELVAPCRVESQKDGRRGTLLYVGPLDDPSNPTRTYYGVDWDDPSGGKHDGRDPFSGAPRFPARHPASGSFLGDPTKLVGAQSFETCVHERYFTDEEDMRKRGTPRILGLAGSRCGEAAAGAPLDPRLARVESLDLSNTMFMYWEDVLDVCQRIVETADNKTDALKELNLSGNHRLIARRAAPTTELPSVRFLVADDSNLWETETNILMCPNLSSLYARRLKSGPFLSAFPRLAQGLARLTELDVSHNQIACGLETWLELVGRALPQLERLNVNSCEFLQDSEETQVGHAKKNDPQAQHPLTHLVWFGMSQCPGRWSWSVLDRVAKRMPKLMDLRCLDVRFRYEDDPISMGSKSAEEREEEESSAVFLRAHLIARLPSTLATLNGSVVAPRERVEAERRYVRYVFERLTSSHPKYSKLLEAHGPPPTLAAPSALNAALSSGAPSRAVKVDFVFPDKRATKSLPRTSTLMDARRVARALRKNDAVGECILVNNREMSKNLSVTIDELLEDHSPQDGSNLAIHFDAT